jgi:glycosyltransferase involved in cell wall biosynthesis
MEHYQATVVIPLLNQQDAWLEGCVRSALEQSVSTQVVVITSPRTCDSNLAVLRELARNARNLAVREQDRDGFARAINCGFALSSCSRVGLLLSDDWLAPTAVEKCLPRNVDIVSTSLAGYAADGKTLLDCVSSDLKESVYDRLPTLEEKADYLSHFFLFRKSKLEEIGGVDEALPEDVPGLDDYDMIWALLERGATVSIVEERLYCYRDHELLRRTLQAHRLQSAGFGRILDKHGVIGRERERLLASHRQWFGKTIQVVQAEIAEAQPRRRVRKAIRAVVQRIKRLVEPESPV